MPELIEVTHAGTARREDGAIVTAGGRVLNVTALGATAAGARDAAYAAARGDRVRRPPAAQRHRPARSGLSVATTPGGSVAREREGRDSQLERGVMFET